MITKLRLNEIGKVLRLLGKNWKALSLFEICYKFAVTVVLLPIFNGCFSLIMSVNGYAYLTAENFASFLERPLTLLLLLILALLVTFCAMVDISAIIYILDQSEQDKTAYLMDTIKFSLKNAARAWNPKNLMLVIVVLVLYPFLNVGMASGMLETIYIPNVLIEYVRARHWMYVMSWVAAVLLFVLVVRWVYSFHYFTLEGCSFREAHKKSNSMGKMHPVTDFLEIVMIQITFGLGYTVFVFLAVAAGTKIAGMFADLFVLHWLTSTVVWMTVLVFMLLAFLLSTPFCYGCISVMFYLRKEERGEAVLHVMDERGDARQKKSQKWISAVVLGIIVVAVFLFGYLVTSGRMNPQIEYIRTTEVTAHRGASADYPENTMAAIQGAKELGADWVELDVQQTKDGEIILMHDANTKRTTGVDANVWELTYAEAAKLDAGSRFGKAFAGEHVPLLSEVLSYAKKNMLRLNIELKPTGHEMDFEKTVVDLVREYGMEDQCVVTSQRYYVLENLKAYDPEISTVYVMSLAYGNVDRLTAADHFSIEASSVTKRLVSTLHNKGKQVFVWTVDSKEAADRMIDRNVDNIITNNVPMVRACVNESRYSDLLTEYIKLLEKE